MQGILKQYKDVTDIQTSESSRFVDSNEPKQLTISSFRPLDTTQVRLSATGDICLGIQSNTQTISSNLCTNPITIANFKNTNTYNLIDSQKRNKAGSMVITAKFCI